MSKAPILPSMKSAPKITSKKPVTTTASKTTANDKVVEKNAQLVVKPLTKAKPIKSITSIATPDVIEKKPAKAANERKATTKRPKLVRDSFTFPATDYALIGTLKQRALTAGREIKKSELLRAGLGVLSALTDTELLKVLDGLDKLKTGRPAK